MGTSSRWLERDRLVFFFEGHRMNSAKSWHSALFLWDGGLWGPVAPDHPAVQERLDAFALLAELA